MEIFFCLMKCNYLDHNQKSKTFRKGSGLQSKVFENMNQEGKETEKNAWPPVIHEILCGKVSYLSPYKDIEP